MADKITIEENNTIKTVDFTYMGDITYKNTPQTFFSGESFNNNESLQDPISYSISKDVFSAVSKHHFYNDVFDDIRIEKQGVGGSGFNLSALAVNVSVATQELSALGETESSSFIIGISDEIQAGDVFSDLVVYSFSTKLRMGDSLFYWKYTESTGLTSDFDPTAFTDEHFFYVKFLDGTYCQVIKQGTYGSKYLTFTPATSSFTFENEADEINSSFIFSYNSLANGLLLGIEGTGVIGSDNTGSISLTGFDSFINEQTNTFIVDNKNALNQKELLNNAFLPRYGVKNSINTSFEVDNMALFTHNYNSLIDKNSNYITLKSNVIYDETYGLTNADYKSDYKQYTSINSGIRGDSGYNNFILGYNTEWFKYEFKPDVQTYFNIPFEMGAGYTQLNINDSRLLENGAIGGDSPLNSDKVYKKLFEYSDFRNTGKTRDVDNSKYLCSWFWYNPLYPSQSRWLDRYYNPDVATKLDALSESGWNTIEDLESFSTSNSLGEPYFTYYKEFNKDVGVFDVSSRLTFQPNSLYMYERIGKEVSQTLLNGLSSDILDKKVDESLNNNNEFFLLTNSTGDDEEFTLNIVLDNFDVDNFVGNKIFGNRTMSLTVDKDFSPYNITVEGSILHYYDFDYNYLKSLDLGEQIDDIIFTDDYNKFYVDCGGILYTVEYLDLITNQVNRLEGNNTITDIKYNKGKLFILDTASNEISSFDPELDVLETVAIANGDNLLEIYNDEIKTTSGDNVFFGDTGDIYSLSSGNVYFENFTFPLVETSGLKDFYTWGDNYFFILNDNELIKYQNQVLTTEISRVTIPKEYELSSFNINRYQRNGEILEYIDVVDSLGVSSNIHRYDTDLNFVETISKTISGDFIKRKTRERTRHLDKIISFKIVLFDIFNYSERGEVEMIIDKNVIDESETCVLNITFSNKYGNISIYVNGDIAGIYKFDQDKYFFSNNLRDNKIYVGASLISDEESIDSVVLSSNGDMISGSCDIKEISIYNKLFDYYDIVNFNRVFREIPPCNLVIPTKKRTYIEEIGGFYNQNKNIRKSEYGSINIYGAELTDAMRTDIKNEIDNLFENTFINLRISQTNFK